MARTDERTRGVTLHLIDWSGLLTQVPTEGDETASVGYDPTAAIEHDGKLFVVCNEGVGWEVTDTHPLVVDVFVSTPGHIALTPKFEATLSPAEVRGMVTDEPVDLADLVRRFGARLECNYSMWYRRLTS